jgi:hypothetical protein
VIIVVLMIAIIGGPLSATATVGAVAFTVMVTAGIKPSPVGPTLCTHDSGHRMISKPATRPLVAQRCPASEQGQEERPRKAARNTPAATTPIAAGTSQIMVQV